MSPASSYTDYVKKYFSEDHAHNAEIADCPICLDEWDSKLVVKTHCGHTFHEPCVLTWLENSRQCPMCRTVLWHTLTEFAANLEITATSEMEDWLRDFSGRDVLDLYPGALEGSGRNDAIFVEASRWFYEQTKLRVPESPIPFINIIRKSSIVVRMLHRYQGKLTAREWLSLMKELDKYRNEVAALDPAHQGPIEGMDWTGLEVWDAMYHVRTAYFEWCDLSSEHRTDLVISYRARNGPANTRSEGRYLVDMRGPVVLCPQDVPLDPPVEDPIRQINAADPDDSEDFDSDDDENLDIGVYWLAPFLKDVIITANYNSTNTHVRIRIALKHPGAISDIPAIGDKSIVIYTKDGYDLRLDY
jgi:hypothetical protein